VNQDSVASIREKVSKAKWYHRFELVPGVMTPGHSAFDAASFLNGFGAPRNLNGMRALDIGSWDGPMAFELERRGAEVVAVDILDPAETGFNTAKEILGSRVRHIQASVYDLTKVLDGKKFDVICFLGVFYHLKHPLLAFEQIREVMSPECLLLLEGACLLHYAEQLDGSPVGSSELAAIRALGKSEIPLSLCYAGRFAQASNWFIPNVACIRAWLQASGLRLEQQYLIDEPSARPIPLQRFSGTARIAAREIVEEHPLHPMR
jgi:tRNA (mo5U34)-methyltransferase